MSVTSSKPKLMKNVVFLVLCLGLFLACDSEYENNKTIVQIDGMLQDGRVLEAKGAIFAFLAEEKENEYAWTLLGHIQEESDKDSLAAQAYHKALTINENMVQAITGLGILARKDKDYELAESYYLRAIELDSKYAEAYASLLVIRIKQNKFQEAVDIGARAYELDKKNPVIAANLCVAYHYNGDRRNREKFFAIAKRNGYDSLDQLKKIFEGDLTVLD